MSTWKIYAAQQRGAARSYIMRKFEYGTPVQSARFCHDDIERMRDLLRKAGLNRKQPDFGDTSDIIEVWQ